MKIGFVSLYSYRPHVEHTFFLEKLFKDSGHETFFLTCDSSVSTCYTRENRGESGLKECAKCVVGGIRSYVGYNVTSISNGFNQSELTNDAIEQLTLSSASTLNRIESNLDCNISDMQKTKLRLSQPVIDTYQSTIKWISDNNLDAVICFNGRIDLTRSVTFACESAGIPFITHERTWLGHGLHLTPNANCLSLKSLRELSRLYKNKPLTKSQAKYAAKLISLRFLQENFLEWRLYNKESATAEWPIESNKKRILILPSSRNEYIGHAEWKTGWPDNTSALDDFFEAFSIDLENVLVRFHPNWSESIGTADGKRIIDHYQKWATEKGVLFIPSESHTNTYDLIEQSDMVVLNGGSSAVEAGACGKQVVCLSPSVYDGAGFSRTFTKKLDLYRVDALSDISPDIVIKNTLRFVYLMAKRFSQFTDYVHARKTTDYIYYHGADVNKLINMLNTGTIQADDPDFATNELDENAIIVLLTKKKWKDLANYNEIEQKDMSFELKRRPLLRWVDGLRSMLPRGDVS